jgi:ABC-type multidrug transport system ATPase subunit
VLLGPNGAGKTTLTRIICGLVDPDAGSVHRSGTVGLVPSGDRTFYLRLSERENMIFFARLHGLRMHEAKRRAGELLEGVGLAEAAKIAVGRLAEVMAGCSQTGNLDATYAVGTSSSFNGGLFS